MFDNVSWQMKQKWEYVGGQWMLTEVKDMSEKVGVKGRKFNTNPPSKKAKRQRSSANQKRTATRRQQKRASSRTGGGSFIDYATGGTPLKVEEKSRTRVGTKFRKRNQDIDDELAK